MLQHGYKVNRGWRILVFEQHLLAAQPARVAAP
jgi:hypothetical protein